MAEEAVLLGCLDFSHRMTSAIAVDNDQPIAYSFDYFKAENSSKIINKMSAKTTI